MRNYYIIIGLSVYHKSLVLSMSMPQWIKRPLGGGRNQVDLMESHSNSPKLDNSKVRFLATYGFTLLVHGGSSEELPVSMPVHP